MKRWLEDSISDLVGISGEKTVARFDIDSNPPMRDGDRGRAVVIN